MKTVYIADDEKEFEDRFECEDYEWRLAHPYLQKVEAYNEEGKRLLDICAEETYYQAQRIVVPTAESVQDLRELGEYSGYSCYDSITEPGTWMFNDKHQKFVKEEAKMKVLVIVDAQNDFITGSLGSEEAQAAVPRMVNRIKEFPQNTLVLFTKDTHYDNYLETQEGKNLPVKHCVYTSKGWAINDEISSVVKEKKFYSWNTDEIINGRILKETFGSVKLAELIKGLNKVEEVTFMGFCTDICVISNVLLVKAYCPELKITVDASCCAGVTPEKHKAALEVMKSCQINVIGEEE